MFKLIEFLKKRPSDLTIRIICVLTALSLAGLLGGFPNHYTLPFQASYESVVIFVKYGLAGFFLFPVIKSAFGLCIFKRKTVKRMQLFIGLFLIVLGISMGPVVQKVEPVNTAGTVSFSTLTTSSTTEKTVHVGGWIILLAFIPLFGGITGKLVTEKCLKHGEVIKKIRV